MAQLDADTFVEELNATVGEALLAPTRLYAQPVRNILRHYRIKNVVHGIAHITGGGLCENLARILPPGKRAIFTRGSWTSPPVFEWLQRLGEVGDEEMGCVFNLGVGLVLVVNSFFADSIRTQLADCGLESWVIGRIEDGNREAVFAN
jgi:phosphoribosylformylglycinamidine cyclo-ligase